MTNVNRMAALVNALDRSTEKDITAQGERFRVTNESPSIAGMLVITR